MGWCVLLDGGEVVRHAGDVRPGLQPQGPGERLPANRLLETRRARVQPCATPGQPTPRVRDQFAPHRDHSQECRPAIPPTAAEAHAYGHRDRESRPVGHGEVYPARLGPSDPAVTTLNVPHRSGTPTGLLIRLPQPPAHRRPSCRPGPARGPSRPARTPLVPPAQLLRTCGELFGMCRT